MLGQVRLTHDVNLWVRRITGAGLPGAAILLFWVEGGFPPQAWYFLARVIPHVVDLWAVRGPQILLPLAGVVALSMTWMILWGMLLGTTFAVVRHQWASRHSKGFAAASWSPERKQFQSPVPIVPAEQASTQNAPAAARKSGGGESVMVGVGWNAGIARSHKPNEDSLIALRGTCTSGGKLLPFGLYVVADGMGGHADGQDASRLAVRTIAQCVLLNIVRNGKINDKLLIEMLVEGVTWANDEVYQRNQEKQIDMGTTITAALVVNANAYVVNVGDSRTYLYRKGEGLTQVTRDHSVVADLVRAGEISPDDVYTHPRRNEVYRGLGSGINVEVDWFNVPLQDDDVLLLCSDGLWEMVRNREIERIIKGFAAEPSQASEALIQAALQGGGSDNIAAIVVCFSKVCAAA